ncbi:hypothetical protein KKI95_18315 [Xenorhabdus bovienii]|uniref:hypothetical protein n=1 Tax=Xenorhabdus bovienii TaxID=40576 RepID=UPI0023B33FDE|nr:hypothetical protein [Xenorhabdus bovienii]MDE9437828.1 hypothetical protein [Xenorhabdus bovienii]MDE9459673.1 hypothetical protein [Xenorhabdus bovienii]MDE9488026.1 hypothetical protein [Xenorhabdus bovienii]MDE9499669.1 hypothetical protein [Xenorhabdus bovienii]MDE9515992.1 hypothetical protein [Xenorhabdus bovienii]
MTNTDKKDKSKKSQKQYSHFIPYKTTYDLRLNKREPNLINILMQIQGYEYGFLTVLGVRPLSQRGNHKNSAIYVVRCRCGKYAVRTLKAIRNPANVTDMCEHCLHLYNLRRRNLFLTEGKEVGLSELTGIKYKKPLEIKE